MSEETHAADYPAIVLVHGAFADASSWNGVIIRLQAKGVQVTAPVVTDVILEAVAAVGRQRVADVAGSE